MKDDRDEKIQLGKTEETVPLSVKERIRQAKMAALANLDAKNFQGDATQSWLKNMANTLNQAEETIVVSTKSAEPTIPMEDLMGELFQQFDRYTFEFNQNPPVKGMTLTVVKPTGFKERIDYDKLNKKSYFIHGHMTGQDFCMILHGEDNLIGVYLLPSEAVLGFTPKNFECYMTIEGSSKEEKRTSWKVLEKAIGPQDLPDLSRRLVGRLIGVAVGNADPTTPFKWSYTEQEKKEDIIDPNRSFEADDVFQFMKSDD